MYFAGVTGREFPSCFIALNLIRKHKIIDLTATAKGLRKHNVLFSCRIYTILNCFVCHFSFPVTLCTVYSIYTLSLWWPDTNTTPPHPHTQRRLVSEGPFFYKSSPLGFICINKLADFCIRLPFE